MTDVARADEASNDRVIAEKTEIIAADPNNAAAYELRCEAWYMKRDWNGAFEDCSAAIRIDPNFGRAYNCRGRAYSAKGDRDHALADYNEAIRLDPAYGPSYTSRAQEYFNKRDFDPAIAGFTRLHAPRYRLLTSLCRRCPPHPAPLALAAAFSCFL